MIDDNEIRFVTDKFSINALCNDKIYFNDLTTKETGEIKIDLDPSIEYGIIVNMIYKNYKTEKSFINLPDAAIYFLENKDKYQLIFPKLK
jgi:hypothetical protein